MRNARSHITLACITGLLVFVCVGSAAGTEYTYTRTMNGRTVTEVAGDGMPTSGDTAAIVSRAQACVARNVTNGPVSSSGSLNAATGRSNTTSGGAPTIELADPAGGQLVANAQVAFTYMFAGRIARARLIVEAKTDKFRVVLLAPTILYSSKSSDADPVVIASGTGGDQALQALTAVADKVTDCILEPKKDW
jgi:hypothetical protein